MSPDPSSHLGPPAPAGHCCFVTGATGFLGSALARLLVADGFRVVGLDVREPLAPQSATESFRRVDLLDAEAVREAVAEEVATHPAAWTLFHLAGQSHVGACRQDPGRAFALNVTSTSHVLEACRGAGVRRVVFPSTALVYDRASGMPLREDAPIAARSVYAATKLAAEALLGGYAADHGFACTVARLGNVYGPGGHPDSVTGMLLRQASRGQTLTVRSAAPVRDFIFRDDVAAGLVAFAATTVDPGLRVLNLASGVPTSVREFAEALCRAAGRAPVLHESDPAATVPDDALVLSVRRVVDIVGWRPQWTLDGALRRSLEEMREERSA